MSNRKHSQNTDQIVTRSKSGKLPAAGTPRLENFQYSGSSGVQLPDDVNDTTGPETRLPAPRNLEVVSQTIRFAPDGTQFVTIVVQFDGVEDATGYEARVAKL